MKEKQSPSYRRRFLTGFAAAAASLGLTGTAHASSDVKFQSKDSSANVKTYGAAGDGKKDDTSAIQAAVNSGAGAVFFPKGLYRVTKTIEVDLNKTGWTSLFGNGSANILMHGAGPVFRFVGTHNKSAAPSTFSQEVWDRQRMPTVDHIGITGSHPEAVGVEAVGTMQLTISRLHVRSARHGIHLKGNNRNIAISDCHLYDNKGIGIFYDDVNLHQSNITGCHISYNAGGGIVSKGGNVRNIHITGCDIESNMSKDTPPTANVFIDCSTSQWGTAEVAITGCTVQHNSESPESANIRIIGGTRLSGSLKRWGNITISGNILSDVMVNLHLKECRGVVISGNTFWEGFTNHVVIENSSNIVMGTNLFDYSPNVDRKIPPANTLRVVNSEDCTFNGVQIVHARGDAGLLIEDSRRINISNCTVLDCSNAGIVLKNVSDSVVSGCIIRSEGGGGDFVALKETGGKGNQIVNNVLPG